MEDCGYEVILNELCGVYEHVNEIEWEKFAIKCTHGFRMNIICTDRKTLDISKTERKLRGGKSYEVASFNFNYASR